jgi:hypothetical protein
MKRILIVLALLAYSAQLHTAQKYINFATTITRKLQNNVKNYTSHTAFQRTNRFIANHKFSFAVLALVPAILHENKPLEIRIEIDTDDTAPSTSNSIKNAAAVIKERDQKLLDFDLGNAVYKAIRALNWSNSKNLTEAAVEEAKKLLEQGANPNSTFLPWSNKPLLENMIDKYCLVEIEVDLVLLLIKHGATVNTKTLEVALKAGNRKGNFDAIKLLVNRPGVDLSQLDTQILQSCDPDVKVFMYRELISRGIEI